MTTAIIYRKKGKAIITTLITLPGLLMFFILSVYGLFSENDIGEKGVPILLLALSSVGIWGILRMINNKILSDNPEFEVNDKKLVVYDNPYYKEIPLEDIIECKIYHGLKGVILLGIRIRKESKLSSNSNALQLAYFNLSEESGKMIFISMSYADIEPDYFAQSINAKVKSKVVA